MMTSEEAREMLTKKTRHRVYALEFLLKEQRNMCADAVIAELKSIGFQIHESGEARIRDACLSATGESDA